MNRFALAAFTVFAVTLGTVSLVHGQMLIFQDELVSDAEWDYSHFGGTAPPIPSPDCPITDGDTAEADFNWDYSQFGIPEAPNSDPGDSATRGLRLAANVCGNEVDDSIAIYHQDAAFTGQYTLQVDIWANWPAAPDNNGSTEFAGAFAGFDPNDVNTDVAPARNGAGLLYTSEGGCGNCDYILLKDTAELDTFSGQFSVVDFGFGNQQGYDATDSDGMDVNLPATFPSFDIATATNNMNGSGTQPAGAPGFQWATLTVEVDTSAIGNGTNGTPGTAKFTLTNAASGASVVIGTVDNSVDDLLDDDMDGDDCDDSGGSEDICTGEAPVNMAGGIALVMIDDFSSTASPRELAFMVFDNVRVYDGFLDDAIDGDYDDDGLVGAGDLSLVLSNWGDDASVTGVPDGWFNQQPMGLIGAEQLSGVLQNWGNTAAPPNVVPEPTSLWLVLVGASLLWARRRSR